MDNAVVCKVCGQPIEVDLYIKQVEDAMLKHEMCFNCNFWREKLEQDKQCPAHTVAIIDGTHYFIDDEAINTHFRGFGGRKFVIHFNDGFDVTTTNLWCQGDIPPQWKDKFPDNATFDWEWKKRGDYNYLTPKDE